MLAIRLLLVLLAVLVVLSGLGYAVSRDRRWLNLAGLGLKGALAAVALLLLLYLVERLLFIF